MKINEEFLIGLVGKKIRFNKSIADWEMYAEKGMHAIVKKWYFDTDEDFPVHKIWVDFSPFEEDNHKRQNANYYNKNGVACLTAVEAGFYHPIDWLYIDPDMEQLPFEVVE